MNNKELINRISQSANGVEAAKAAPAASRKLVVFTLGEKLYALDAGEVKEVVIIGDVYFVPFMPPYVAGFINRHGEPHTLIDLPVILDNVKIVAPKALVMNRRDDQIAFLITDIQKILNVPESEIRGIPPSGGTLVFTGSFSHRDQEVFILNPQDVYDRLQLDIKNI